MCSATPAGHLCTVRRSIDWIDAHPCRTRRMAHGWVEKLEQGPEKSGCFYGLLRWSVGRHWLLRSQCTYSRQRTRIRQSAFMLIAFGAAVNKSGNGVAIDNKAKLSSRSGAQPQITHCPLCALLNTGESFSIKHWLIRVFDQTLPAYSLLNSVF